jgi:hypothetical protein
MVHFDHPARHSIYENALTVTFCMQSVSCFHPTRIWKERAYFMSYLYLIFYFTHYISVTVTFYIQMIKLYLHFLLECAKMPCNISAYLDLIYYQLLI